MSRLFLFASLVALACAGGDGGETYGANTAVLNLDGSNFDTYVGTDAAFVEFYAPWCGHCKNLAPEYEKVASAFKGLPVKIAAVDADKHRDVGSRFGVSGFPTLKWFPAGSKEGEAYNGGRTAADIVKFVNEKTGLNGRVKEAPSASTVLTEANFDKIVLNSNKFALVEFYAPWCGHCKKLAPDYEKLAAIFANEPNVVIAKLDATVEKEPASRYGVSGYPTIKWFSAGSSTPEDYNGGRSIPDFVTFINEKTGTERTATGGYIASAGRIDELDTIAAKIASGSGARADLLTQLDTATAAASGHKNAAFAKFYGITAKKIVEKGAGYAADEASRLQKMIDGGKVASNKLEEFYKRINIANAFSA